MDFNSFVMFITGGSLLAALATGVLKQVLKNVNDRWGSLMTQILLFVVSVVIAILFTASSLLPTVWLVTAGSIFAGAMIIYEVLYKALWQQAVQGKV